MLSDRDRELAKKYIQHGFGWNEYFFTKSSLATFLAERDVTDINVGDKLVDDAVRDALEKAAQIAGIAHENYERLKEVHVMRTPKAFVPEHYNINMDIVGYSKVSEDKIRALIEPKG
jgi:hypothetical protein